jgi:hypothetical protein
MIVCRLLFLLQSVPKTFHQRRLLRYRHPPYRSSFLILIYKPTPDFPLSPIPTNHNVFRFLLRKRRGLHARQCCHRQMRPLREAGQNYHEAMQNLWLPDLRRLYEGLRRGTLNSGQHFNNRLCILMYRLESLEGEVLDFIELELRVWFCLWQLVCKFVWLASERKKKLIISLLAFHGFPAVHPVRSPPFPARRNSPPRTLERKTLVALLKGVHAEPKTDRFEVTVRFKV